jgi:hypothetical protein
MIRPPKPKEIPARLILVELVTGEYIKVYAKDVVAVWTANEHSDGNIFKTGTVFINRDASIANLKLRQ